MVLVWFPLLFPSVFFIFWSRGLALVSDRTPCELGMLVFSSDRIPWPFCSGVCGPPLCWFLVGLKPFFSSCLSINFSNFHAILLWILFGWLVSACCVVPIWSWCVQLWVCPGAMGIAWVESHLSMPLQVLRDQSQSSTCEAGLCICHLTELLVGEFSYLSYREASVVGFHSGRPPKKSPSSVTCDFWLSGVYDEGWPLSTHFCTFFTYDILSIIVSNEVLRSSGWLEWRWFEGDVLVIRSKRCSCPTWWTCILSAKILVVRKNTILRWFKN